MSRASVHSSDAEASVKFLNLFGKSTPPAARHIKQPTAQASAAAQETVRKIDAIESEISAELDACAPTDTVIDTATDASTEHDATLAPSLAQRIDEASLLYASHQPQAAESLLLEAVAQRSGCAHEPIAWLMLLELACAAGSQSRFEELALRYAQRFETSPPQWRSASPAAATPAAVRPPKLSFRGELSGHSSPALERFAQMAVPHLSFSIDLQGITTADNTGCEHLLNLLKQWLSEGRHIELLPAPALANLLRVQLDAGPAGDHDSLWRLLIELLRVGGDAAAHEDACIAYSVAREVSPPAPLLPQPLPALPERRSLGISLPAEIHWPVDTLLESLRAQIAQAPTAPAIVLDCSRLQLIEFNAAAPLLAGLARLADGKTVEWRDLSYLVSTLLHLIGGVSRLRIINRKP